MVTPCHTGVKNVTQGKPTRKNMLRINYFLKDFTLNPDLETTFITNVFLIECLFQKFIK